ncbi:type IV pilus secretin PilQ [Nitrogeniibacter mangrovi]|uniref:Type IV pilus biogenesis and competence protein PilQ n=1 Tax=Nitrogeniibacter mangrovi TaxID=2016596 RepID=A0A6C1B385_9RHOO|nr:type IV pilus secretin PilQ [Nitrogeniibacter mangrovi]QID16790.1 type IV pilus secretin PilQ [Nitrogeniibacter mangrovi]
MKWNKNVLLVAAGLLMAHVGMPAFGQAAQVQKAEAANKIEALDVSRQGADIFVKVRLKEPLAQPPASFSVASPARIAFDFPGTGNALGRNVQEIAEGDLRSANIVQVGDRTRLVLNLLKMTPYDTSVNGNDVVIALSPVRREPSDLRPSDKPFASFAPSKESPNAVSKSIRDINFRRGVDGEGRIVVQLSDPDTGIDIRQQGQNLIVDFLKTSLPGSLQRKSDVTDFATPVTEFTAQAQGENTRLVVKPNGLWEHNAYQSDNQFVLEVKRVVEDPKKLIQGGGKGKYQGEKLSLNFQNIDVRSVLQVIADFTNFNIITSDTVQGSLTLRLKDVPWDQALDIILQAKGLDKRKHGNVIWIAPRDEIAAREKLELESLQQIGDLEPLKTESFQINYHDAKAIFDFLKNKDQTVLSKRGSVIVDTRSNKVFVTDVSSRLDDLRRLIQEIDVPPRQVLIEARIVEAQKGFAKDLGARLGVHQRDATAGSSGFRTVIGGSLLDTGFHTGQVADTPNFLADSLSVNMPASPSTGTAGAFSFILANSALTRFLNLEISALEADNRGRVISSPRVMTANQVEAVMEQGTEIPYQQATSSGATSVQFRKAVLSLKVKPNITPDGRVQLYLEVNKDTPGETVPGGVAIDTKHVKTEVMVENGGTVVIGGVYEETESSKVQRVPLLGEIPVLGALFRNKQNISERSELLVFITPKIVTQALSLR